MLQASFAFTDEFKKLVFSVVGMFVAMDIIGALPIYLGITRSMDKSKRLKILKQSIFVAGVVSLSFVLIGKSILKFLGIGLYDFMIGGGIVLLVMAILDLVHRKKDEDHSHSTGIVPLAMPIIAGPALITTIMLQVTLYGHIIVIIALALNFIFAWLALGNSHLITKYLGEEGTDVVSKLGALFLTAIAVAMIRRGVFEFIHS